LAAVAHISHQIAVMYLGKIVEVADSLELCGKPLHPYTKPLFTTSLPSHPDEEREEIVLSCEVPSALHPPSGCHFHPRCPFAMARCSGQELKLVEASAGHQVACYLY
jgi:oligopeptide/dipeptide ABC transporter ATP-binding protein